MDNVKITDIKNKLNDFINKVQSFGSKKVKLTQNTLLSFKKGIRKKSLESQYNELNKQIDVNKDYEYNKETLSKLSEIGVKLIKFDYKQYRLQCIKKAKPIKVPGRILPIIKAKYKAYHDAPLASDVVISSRESYQSKIDELKEGLNNQKVYDDLKDYNKFANYPRKPIREIIEPTENSLAENLVKQVAAQYNSAGQVMSLEEKIRILKENGKSNDEIINELKSTNLNEIEKIWYTLGKLDEQGIGKHK